MDQRTTNKLNARLIGRIVIDVYGDEIISIQTYGSERAGIILPNGMEAMELHEELRQFILDNYKIMKK